MNLSRWWGFLSQTLQNFSQDRALRMAAALAYYSTFSLAPLLIIATWVAGLFFGTEAARGEIFSEFRATLGDRAAELLQDAVTAAYENSDGIWATAIGIVLLLFGATGVFAELEDSLNNIWKVKREDAASWWLILRARLLSFSVVLGCGFLLLISLVISSVLNALYRYVSAWDIPGGVWIWQGLHLLVSLLVITLLLAMIFKLLPAAPLRWRDMWIGAFITAVLFTLGKFLIGVYLAHGSVASAYGAAGTLVVVLLWVYYSSVIVLFGAEFTHVYATRKRAEEGQPDSFLRERGPAPMHPVRTGS